MDELSTHPDFKNKNKQKKSIKLIMMPMRKFIEKIKNKKIKMGLPITSYRLTDPRLLL